MNVITINASDLNGGIGSEIEKIVRADYSKKVTDRVLEHADVNGADGLMFMAGFEACRALLLNDVAPVELATECTMLFYEAAWEAARQMGGMSVEEAMRKVIDAVVEVAEAKVEAGECTCKTCRAKREAEGQ